MFNACVIPHLDDIVVVVDLDAGAGIIVALHDGWGPAVGTLDGDWLILGAVTLPKGTWVGNMERSSPDDWLYSGTARKYRLLETLFPV